MTHNTFFLPIWGERYLRVSVEFTAHTHANNIGIAKEERVEYAIMHADTCAAVGGGGHSRQFLKIYRVMTDARK